MQNNSLNDKKNILDFEFFKLRKKRIMQENASTQETSLHTVSANIPRPLEEIELSTRIHNIKASVQRINQLISELRHISDKPHK
ncbi:hypothetical protein [Silvanigrella aquatica]|uniref:Uncharacterized protein n=1 Tax=Silvanigrella aquatica TaxID=1915309 RepID=A0A1L4CZ42_9BACT|nr:hypothetical protein [Silvanigrella aquatica]APJ03233.1 hypothetical protein AXG55_04665 [Silvanigrella aquatica]